MSEAAAETSDAGDIRSALAAAITEHEPVEAPAPKAEARTVETDDGLTAKDKEQQKLLDFAKEQEGKQPTERVRAKDGKFAKEEDADGNKAEIAVDDGKEKPQSEEGKNNLAPDFQRALAAWKPEDQAMFKGLAPDAQQFVMRRYKEMTADYTKKLQDVSRIKTDYEPVDKIFEPHRDVMKQKGLTPASLVEAWSNVEKKLASGDDGAVDIIRGLQRGYNIPVAKIAAALGITAGQQQASQTATEQQQQPQRVQLPPELINELTNLRQQVTGLTAAQQAAQDAARIAAGDKAMHDIEQFKSAVDDKGTLLRPHFEEVEQDMVDLANSFMQAKKPVPPLAELYETAVWANPSTRDRMLTARQQAEQQKRVDQDKSKAAAARKAAVSVTGAPGNSQAREVRHAPERSLRDELMANMDEQSAA